MAGECVRVVLLNSGPKYENVESKQLATISGAAPDPTDRPSGCRFHTKCPEFIDGRCIRSTPDLRTVDGEADREVACHWNDRSEAEHRSHITPSDSEREGIEREVAIGYRSICGEGMIVDRGTAVGVTVFSAPSTPQGYSSRGPAVRAAGQVTNR